MRRPSFCRFCSVLLCVLDAVAQHEALTYGGVSDNGEKTVIWQDKEEVSPQGHTPKSSFYEDETIQALHLTETPDRTYYVSAGFGTPSQFLRLLLHTGIADIWVRECHSFLRLGCLAEMSYWPAHSLTASKTAFWKEYDLRFHPSTFVAGHLAMDNIQLGNKIIQDQAFAVFDRVYHTATDSKSFTVHEGFFGLGHPSGTLLEKEVFIENMVQQNLIKKKLLSIYLQRAGGELIVGGINPQHHQSEHIWVNAWNEDGGWQMLLEDVYMRGAVRTCDVGCSATISTVTSHIAGPPDAVKAINRYLSSSSSKKVRRIHLSCADRVYSIVKECFHQKDNDISAKHMCLSMGWCEPGHLEDGQRFTARRLLEQDSKNFKHSFGCAACMTIAEFVQGMDKIEDYEPEFGASLCNWLEPLWAEVANNDTEEVDCDAISSFEFFRITVNDEYLYVDSPYYIYKRVYPNLEITCHTEFVPYEDLSGEKEGYWILGTSFLRAHHTVIDYSKRTLGFAKPAKAL